MNGRKHRMLSISKAAFLSLSFVCDSLIAKNHELRNIIRSSYYEKKII